MSFFTELKRRNVMRVAAGYVVAAWLVVQVVETIFPAFGFSDAAIRIVVIVFAIGLIPTLILAWAFELTSRCAPSDPVQCIGDNFVSPGLCAIAVRDQQSFRVPGQQFITGGTGRPPPEKTCAPLAWCAAVLSDQAIQPHQPPLPAGHFHFGVALDQVTDDRTSGLAMEEHDLLHRNRAMKYDLIDVCSPGRIGLVA